MTSKHSDVCTPALCYCFEGVIDGTPVSSDYKNTNQPLPGHGKEIDLDKVYIAVKRRMGNREITEGLFKDKK